MSDLPVIICAMQFITPSSTDENAKNFFYCKEGFDHIDYCDRKGASEKLSPEEIKKAESFMQLNNSNKDYSYVDYSNERFGSTGIFTANENFTEQDKADLKAKLSKTQSNIWTPVISFTPEFAREFCNNREKARELIINSLPELVKDTKLDINNIDWFGAFHINTDNPHIHLTFWEKEPQNINSKGKKTYTKNAKIPTKNLDAFKTQMAKYLKIEKLSYLPMRDEIKKGVLLGFKDNRSMFEQFLQKSGHIIEGGKFQYNRLDQKDKNLVKNFVEITLNSDKNLRKKYDDYLANLENTQSELIGLFSDLHFAKNQAKKIPQNVTNFYSSRVNELDDRLCNAFLKELKNYAHAHDIFTVKYIDKNNKNNYNRENADEKNVVNLDKLKKTYSGSVYRTVKNDMATKKNAVATRELLTIADNLVRDFMINGASVVADCEKSVERYKRECIEQGQELIYEDFYENN